MREKCAERPLLLQVHLPVYPISTPISLMDTACIGLSGRGCDLDAVDVVFCGFVIEVE